ncbi:hypothetical protein MRX96_002633 [Rhipicephalus microplus]
MVRHIKFVPQPLTWKARAFFGPTCVFFFSSENLELFMKRRGELNMIRCRLSMGLLNVSAVDPEAFRLLLRFQKDIFDSLCGSLDMPADVTSVQSLREAGAQVMRMTL